MAFSYKDYEESDKVKQYKTDLDTHNQNKVADWTGGTYGQGMNDALNRVLNRDKFSYDLNSDAIYNQYKNQYINLGKLAMQDTMGQAAALTGGYGNSYAATVGNQAYQGYLQQLNNVVPELYQMALNQYTLEGENLKDQYSMLANQYNTEYGQYRDMVADWNNQRDYLTGLYNDERTYDYGMYSDDRNFSYTDYWNNLQMEYQKERDAVADEQWQKQYEASLRSSGDGGVGNPKLKTPSDTMFENALSKYVSGGDEALAAYIDKYPEYDGEAILNYVLTYAPKKKTSATTKSTHSISAQQNADKYVDINGQKWLSWK